MNEKSLRYTHEANCKGEITLSKEIPVKRRIKKNVVKVDNNEIVVSDDVSEAIFKTMSRIQAKLKMKEDNFKKLTQLIA